MPVKTILKEMPIEEALNILEGYVNEIASVDNLVDYIKNNREEFIQKWGKVNQYYKYIIYYTDDLNDSVIKAIDIISDLAACYPILGKWVDLMIEPKKNKNQLQNTASIDQNGVSEYVEAITNEIFNMPQWDENRVLDIQNQLQEFQALVMANKSVFEINVYQNIMDNISKSLDRIERFGKILKLNPNNTVKVMK